MLPSPHPPISQRAAGVLFPSNWSWGWQPPRGVWNSGSLKIEEAKLPWLMIHFENSSHHTAVWWLSPSKIIQSELTCVVEPCLNILTNANIMDIYIFKIYSIGVQNSSLSQWFLSSITKQMGWWPRDPQHPTVLDSFILFTHTIFDPVIHTGKDLGWQGFLEPLALWEKKKHSLYLNLVTFSKL